jgi:hypothetical protein
MWQPILRSDAAARTGMALYGIEGMTPELTTINAEGTAVRTVYRLPTDGVLEVIQQLREDRRDAPVNIVAEAPVVDVQNARLQQQAQGAAQSSAGSANQGRIAVPPVDAVQGGISPPPWSTVRGDVLLTLRGVADAAALASRLRRD